MTAPTRVTWAEIQRLRTAGTPERTVLDVIRAHGLDLPHAPAVRLGHQPTGGLQQWEVFCQACELHHGRRVTACLLGIWTGPTYLVNPQPIQRAVDLALAASRDAGRTLGEYEAGRHRT